MSPADFHTTVRSRYHSLQQRVRKFYGMNVPLPFSLEDYQDWILIQLGEPSGHSRCAYCGCQVSFETMVVDHRIPLEQAGPLDLVNLAVSCDPCNQQKGAMMPLAFSALRELGLNRKIFTQTDWDNLRARLQAHLKLARRIQIAEKRNALAAKVRVVAHRREAG